MNIPLRFSHLRAMSQSPAHCHYAMTRDDDEQTAATDRGSALHAIILGNRNVVVAGPDAPKKPSAAQRNAKKPSPATVDAIAWWADFDAKHANDIVLSAAKMNDCQRMADAIRANPLALEVLDGVKEHTLRYRLQGRDCRATPDVRAADNRYITDLKSTVTADPARFKWQAIKYGIVAQLSWYRTACDVLYGAQPTCFVVAVEATRPHPVTVFKLTDADMLRGQKSCALWFERLMSCEASNQWPAYAQSIVDLDLPDNEFELDFSGVDADDESGEETE